MQDPMAAGQWETLKISAIAPGVVECRLHRPDKRNALSLRMWDEIRDFFGAISTDGSIRVVLLTGEGKLFCSGVDMEAFTAVGAPEGDIGHTALKIRSVGKHWQDAFTNLEKCGKVVIACVHGACIGAGVELIAAADIRFCSADAVFGLKEVDVGLAADVGGLQRFPRLVGNQSLVRELVFSGRNLSASEALPFGLVSRICPSREALMQEAVELAKVIASKSPIALLGAKTLLNYSRDHSVDESLEYAITWNQSMLQSREVAGAAMAQLSKKPATFPDLPSFPRVSSKL
mmetsp:Transcript_70359/g.228720  ORF Transcript_70359/g.228720 Transcript_70359/m.228720 type:complete len:289 (+) Transcript_70359:56-922(+)|eukprot:CAMPEP_0203888286 /NCGR_PEP_ID=MMETSP0359-20131031/31913_1 /ASSEMBLY_ACC=CAM_ASM_000338 /TAXON_ID=268821 /ORGANISM="Scrippsiella Hangoei, Strain SHTV-5" /LENGTH=288 /DNA_ID=CAMNT_0050809447 /DNA_START=29 /DNA_END=895 /DNA_ORIENTATION=-